MDSRTFLASEGLSLGHKAAREFEESMVKRDKQGQFAKKADKTLGLEDSVWMEQLEALKDGIIFPAADDVAAFMKKYLSAHPEIKMGSKFPQQMVDGINTIVNSIATQRGTNVSPSGKYVAKVSLSDSQDDYDVKFVKNPNYAQYKTEQVSAILKAKKILDSWNGGGSGSGNLFNPEATIDTSRIMDVGNNTKHFDEGVVMDTNTFLEKEGLVLGHVSAKEFQESSVNRDAKGQFSSIDVTTVDDLWLDPQNLETLKALIMDAAHDELESTYMAMIKAAGLEEEDSNPEIMNALVDILNKESERSGVSPSGNFRVNFVLDSTGQDVRVYAVPHFSTSHSPERHEELALKAARELAAMPDGGELRFNPNATIDTSRIKQYAKHSDEEGNMDVNSFLEKEGVTLQHKTSSPTIGDVVKAMTPKQRDLMDLFVGAAAEKVDLPPDPAYSEVYDTLSQDQKNVIDFICGAVLSEHAGAEGTIAHHGVKGMRWGIRNEDGGGSKVKNLATTTTKAQRAAAKARVKAGTGTLGDAHLAAIKGTGHRVADAMLGDKHYWKNMGLTAAMFVGAVGVAAAATALAPAVLPASALTAVAATFGLTGYAGAGTTTAALGAQAIGSAIVSAAAYAAGTSGTYNAVTNTIRAVKGNSEISKSYADLGSRITKSQRAGSEHTRRILQREGSLRGNRVRPKVVAHTDLIDAFLESEGVSLGKELSGGSDELEHHGVPGMRWGVRKESATGESNALVSPKRLFGISNPNAKFIWGADVPKSVFDLSENKAKMIHAKAQMRINEQVNVKPVYKGMTKDEVQKGSTPRSKAYANEVAKTYEDVFNEHVKRAKIYNALVLASRGALLLTVGSEILTHSEDSPDDAITMFIDIDFDENGHIKLGNLGKVVHGVVSKESEFENILAHYGIPGMKWGIRRADGPAGTVSSNPKYKAKRGLSEDGARAKASMETLKRHGMHALSDADLQHLRNRLQLEQSMRDIRAQKTGSGHTFIRRMLKYADTANGVVKFTNSPLGLILAQVVDGKPRGANGQPTGLFQPKPSKGNNQDSSQPGQGKSAKKNKKKGAPTVDNPSYGVVHNTGGLVRADMHNEHVVYNVTTA